MKKGLLLLVLIFFLTGCSNIDNRDKMIDGIISSKYKTNKVSNCYKYYLPLGVTNLMDHEFNGKLKYKNNIMYLYVDVVSYNYKNTLNFETTDINNYYYKSLDNNGFIEITTSDDEMYFTTIVYNYGKIEFESNFEQLNDTLAAGLIVLKSIKYNDAAIEKLNIVNSSKETVYEIDKPSDAESKFSQYLEEYVSDEEVYEKLPDE